MYAKCIFSESVLYPPPVDNLKWQHSCVGNWAIAKLNHIPSDPQIS